MARKSKYEHSSAKLSTTLWKPALYIRLSREDGDREESNSIASQRELLTEFVDTQTDMTSPRDVYKRQSVSNICAAFSV